MYRCGDQDSFSKMDGGVIFQEKADWLVVPVRRYDMVHVTAAGATPDITHFRRTAGASHGPEPIYPEDNSRSVSCSQRSS